MAKKASKKKATKKNVTKKKTSFVCMQCGAIVADSSERLKHSATHIGPCSWEQV